MKKVGREADTRPDDSFMVNNDYGPFGFSNEEIITEALEEPNDALYIEDDILDVPQQADPARANLFDLFIIKLFVLTTESKKTITL